jgi:hypothetical protein
VPESVALRYVPVTLHHAFLEGNRVSQLAYRGAHSCSEARMVLLRLARRRPRRLRPADAPCRPRDDRAARAGTCASAGRSTRGLTEQAPDIVQKAAGVAALSAPILVGNSHSSMASGPWQTSFRALVSVRSSSMLSSRVAFLSSDSTTLMARL